MDHGAVGHPPRGGHGLSELDDAVEAIRAQASLRPRVGVVLGSGLGGFADAVEGAVEIPYAEIPGWPASTAVGHAGTLVLGTLAGIPVGVMKGRAHLYEGIPPAKVVFGLRPDDLYPTGHGLNAGDASAVHQAELKVSITEPLGNETLVFLDFAGRDWIGRMLNPRPLHSGDRISVSFDLSQAHLFDAASGKTLRT